MKKKLFLFALVFFVLGSNAQLTLSNATNAPIVGDMLSMAKYDSTTTVPKSTGTGMSWNFSSFTVGSFTEALTYTTVASTPAASLFPTSNLALVRGGSNFEYYNSQASSLAFTGMADPSNTVAVVMSNNGTWMDWPKSFGNSSTDNFSATETSPTYTNTWTGTITLNAAGSGTVTLPNGNKHNNCLQVIRTITVNVSGTQTYSMYITQYNYYSSSKKFPILTTEYQTQKTGTVVSKSYDAYVDVSAMSVGIKESLINCPEFKVYPNPAVDRITIYLPDNENAVQIELYDIKGQLVLIEKNSNTVNTESLAKGLYFVKVKTKGSILEGRIVISE